MDWLAVIGIAACVIAGAAVFVGVAAYLYAMSYLGKDEDD